MVRDHHQRPGAVGGIDSAGGVRQDDDPRSEPAEQEHRLDDEPGMVALVEVEPPLEHDGRGSGETPEQEPADVAGRGRGRPARELGEGDRDRILQLVGESAEAGSEDDPGDRNEIGSGADCGLERVETGRLVRRRDRRRGGRHGRAGLRERVQGEDGRGPLR